MRSIDNTVFKICKEGRKDLGSILGMIGCDRAKQSFTKW